MTLKVLHVVESLQGGPATYLNTVVPDQVSRYESVSVLCRADEAHHLNINGASIYPFSNTGRSSFGVLGLVGIIWGHLRHNKYDVVHLHSTYAGLAGRIVGRLGSSKVVYCAHGWSFAMNVSSVKRWAYATVERILATRSDAIINISHEDSEAAKKYGLPGEKMITIPNGIKDAQWSPLTEKTPTKLLFVGRFDRQKGLDILLDAMPSLKQRGFSLRTIGARVHGGLIAEPNLDCVTNLGWQPPSVIQTEINHCDIVIIPSRWEGFGLVAIEAMRGGRPVIASNVGGLSGIVVHEQTGILVPPETSEEITAAVERIVELGAKNLGESARRRYDEMYNAQRMLEAMDNLYLKLLSEKGSRSGVSIA